MTYNYYNYKNSPMTDLLSAGNTNSNYYTSFGSYLSFVNGSTNANNSGNAFKQGLIGYQVSGTDLGPTFVPKYVEISGVNGLFVGPTSDVNSDTTGRYNEDGYTQTSINYSYYVPSACSIIRGILIGGGGGGGAGGCENAQPCGASGGSGASLYFEITRSKLPSDFLSIGMTVGGGGNGAVGHIGNNDKQDGHNGGNGGDTILYYNTNTTTVTLITCGGGGGGTGGKADSTRYGGNAGGITVRDTTIVTYTEKYDGVVGNEGGTENAIAGGVNRVIPTYDPNFYYTQYPSNFGVDNGNSGTGGYAPSNNHGNGGYGGAGGIGRIYFVT